MSRPFTRIVGEPRNRCAAAASESRTSTRRTVATTPASATTRLTSSRAGSACGQPAKVRTSTSGSFIGAPHGNDPSAAGEDAEVDPESAEAAGQGFEPQLPVPETGVLPLDDPARVSGNCSRAPCGPLDRRDVRPRDDTAG